MIMAPPLNEIWPTVEPKIDRIRQRTNQPWATKDVYSALATGKAYLYCSDDRVSFAVVKPKVDRYSGDIVLFVWLAWGLNGKRAVNLEMLHELARGIGATGLEMESPRRGFERTGWEVKAITYTMEVLEA